MPPGVSYDATRATAYVGPVTDSGVVATPSGNQRVWSIDPSAVDDLEKPASTSPEAAPL